VNQAIPFYFILFHFGFPSIEEEKKKKKNLFHYFEEKFYLKELVLENKLLALLMFFQVQQGYQMDDLDVLISCLFCCVL